MFKTEEEAKKCWCPESRVWVGDDGLHTSANRFIFSRETSASEHDACRCLASECMLWRWANDKVLNEAGDAVDRGYCGLAGASKP